MVKEEDDDESICAASGQDSLMTNGGVRLSTLQRN